MLTNTLAVKGCRGGHCGGIGITPFFLDFFFAAFLLFFAFPLGPGPGPPFLALFPFPLGPTLPGPGPPPLGPPGPPPLGPGPPSLGPPPGPCRARMFCRRRYAWLLTRVANHAIRTEVISSRFLILLMYLLLLLLISLLPLLFCFVLVLNWRLLLCTLGRVSLFGHKNQKVSCARFVRCPKNVLRWR